MPSTNRIILLAAVAAAVSVMTTLGQLPIPVQGQRGGQPLQQGQGGQRSQGMRRRDPPG